MVAEALTRVRSLAIDEARACVGDPGTLWLDVREPGEWRATGIVPGALTVPRGLLEFVVDPTSRWHRPAFAPAGRRVLVVCGIGWRSALAAEALQRLGVPDVAHLDGGIEAWIAVGGPLVAWSPAAEGLPQAPVAASPPIPDRPDGAAGST